MKNEDAKTERLRALTGAMAAALPPGIEVLTPGEQEKIQNETTAAARKRIGALYDAVIDARVLGAPLVQAQLEQLAIILAGILKELDGTKRGAGRRRRDHRLLVIDFLLRKRASPSVAPKKFHAEVAADWGTTDANVKKLVTENRRSALALLEEIGPEKAARTVRSATKSLQRYRNRS